MLQTWKTREEFSDLKATRAYTLDPLIEADRVYITWQSFKAIVAAFNIEKDFIVNFDEVKLIEIDFIKTMF